MPFQKDIWSKCLEHLKQSLTHSNFIEYIQPLVPVWLGSDLILWAPNIYVTERAAHFQPNIINALLNAGVDCAVRFQKRNPESLDIVDDNQQYPALGLADGQPKTNKRSVSADKTFERFIVGGCNRRVFEVAKSVVRQALNQGSLGMGTTSANLVTFWGGVGVGKTHLLHAINNELKAQGVAGVGYVQAESFRRGVVQGITDKNIQPLMQQFANLNLLLVDDLHWLASAKKCQLEMLCLLERLVSEQGAQMVLTCGHHPSRTTGLDGRLADRLGGGLVVPFEPHTAEVKSGLLIQQAADCGRSISPEVAFQAATSMDDRETGRSITGVIKQLCLTAVGQPISLQEIDDALTRRRNTCRVSVERILQVTAEYYETSAGALMGKRRTRAAVNARHTAMYLCKKMTAASYSEIAAIFGNRHHTAVMHACRKISKQVQTNVELAQDTQGIKRRLVER